VLVSRLTMVPASIGRKSPANDRKAILRVYIASANIVMLGDSITASGDWVKLLKQPNILNLGIGGDSSAGVLNRLNQIIARKPRTVFLMIGINDLFNDIPLDLIERHIQLIASQLVKNGIKPIIQSTLFVQGNSDLNAKIRALDDNLRQWCAERKINFVDLNEVLSSNGSLRADVSDDGVHLNNNGYVLWRDAIRCYIDDAPRHL
jgi:lysophospholipase L1-like esterase